MAGWQTAIVVCGPIIVVVTALVLVEVATVLTAEFPPSLLFCWQFFFSKTDRQLFSVNSNSTLAPASLDRQLYGISPLVFF